MELSRQEFGRLVQVMKAVYAHPTFIADKDAFETWYFLLKDIPYQILQVAVQMHVQSCKFPPTIADLREAAAKIAPSDKEITDLEAWALVHKAICRSGYYSEEEFEKLPPLVKKAVGRHENLKEWSQMDTGTVGSVVQSQFLRSYRAVQERSRELSKLSPDIQERLGGVDNIRIGRNDMAYLENMNG